MRNPIVTAVVASCALMIAGVSAFVGVAVSGAWAQGYPLRMITMVVPFPAGGGVDAMARITAGHLSRALGQQVIIDNRGGAAGVIGTRAAVKAAPDGYTLVMSTSGTTSINPILYANPGYDPLKDFIPIGFMASTPIAVMAHPSFPAKTLGEMIVLAKRSGRLEAGTPPPGTENYLAAELFKSMIGADMTIVTYKGTGPLTNDLLGNHIAVAFNTLGPALGNIQSGLLRVLAVAAPKRSGLLPDVPTAEESGLPGFEAAVRYGLLAPAGTPRPVVDRINKELQAMAVSDAERALIAAQGGEPLATSSEEFAADIARDQAKWGPLIHKLGLRVD